MSSKDEFEARLKRIQHTRGGTPASAAQNAGPEDWQLPARKGRKGGFPFTIVVAGVVSLGLSGFAALYFIAHLGLTVPYSAGAEVGANLAGSSIQPVQPGWLDRLFGTGLAQDKSGDPLAYLPAAPAGWARMTMADAQQPDALALFIARWPNSLGPVDGHPGHGDLLEFVRIYDQPDAEQRFLSETRTRALYLGPDGQILSLRLQFRSEREALGSGSDPASWAAALRPEVEAAAQLGEEVKSYDLDGLTVFNRTAQRAANTRLDLTVALHSRAMVEIRGSAKPEAANALLAAIDRPALADRLTAE